MLYELPRLPSIICNGRFCTVCTNIFNLWQLLQRVDCRWAVKQKSLQVLWQKCLWNNLFNSHQTCILLCQNDWKSTMLNWAFIVLQSLTQMGHCGKRTSSYWYFHNFWEASLLAKRKHSIVESTGTCPGIAYLLIFYSQNFIKTHINSNCQVTIPSALMTFIQRRLNVGATSWRCIDVEPTLYKRHVPAGKVRGTYYFLHT